MGLPSHTIKQDENGDGSEGSSEDGNENGKGGRDEENFGIHHIKK